MNIKKFTLLTASALILVGGVFFSNSSKEVAYFPKKIESTEAAGAQGYVDFMRSIKADPATGVIDYDLVQAGREQVKRMPKNKLINLQWNFKGPDNVGGRTRALIIDRNDNNHLLAGGVAGGVWESFDGAETWEPYDPDFKIKNISTITQAADGEFYIGTGEQFVSGSSNNINTSARGVFFVGTGLHKLIGGGEFETLLQPVNRINSNTDWATFGQIEADLTDPNKLYVGMNNGFRVLTIQSDGSVDVQSPIAALGNARCNDIEVLGNGRVIAVFDNVIYASNDGAQTFSQIFDIRNEISGSVSVRIETAVAPSNKDIIYAAAGNTGGAAACVAGVFRSRDGGQNWEIISPVNSQSFGYMGNPVGCQAFWNNAITVDPNDPGRITVGGVRLLRWVQSSVDPAPANGSWTSIASTLSFTGPRYVHADKHKIVYDPTNSNTAYIASDGGVAKSRNFNDPIPNFTENNFNYAVTQFYGMGANQNDIVMAGSQDNGTQLMGLKINSGLTSRQVLGGDGFDAVLSKIDPDIGVGTLYFNFLARIQGIGTNGSNSNISTANIVNSNDFIGGACGTQVGCSRVFYHNIALWESFDHKGSRDIIPVRVDSAALPPLVAVKDIVYDIDVNGDTLEIDTIYNTIPFESRNNDIAQIRTLKRDFFPVDTLIGDSESKSATIGASGLLQLIIDFDTLIINAQSKQIIFDYRSKSREIIPYTDGVPVTYSNALLAHDFQTSEILIDGINVSYETTEIEFRYEIPTIDRVQSILASSNWPGNVLPGDPAGVEGVDYSARNIFITRDLLKGATQINWYNVAGRFSTPNSITTNVLTMEFSRDGNHLFAGTTDGRLYRIDDINSVTADMIQSTQGNLYRLQQNGLAGKCFEIGRFSGGSVTDIAVDPNNANNLLVAIGNYTNSIKVWRATDGLEAINRTQIRRQVIDSIITSVTPPDTIYKDSIINKIVFEPIEGQGTTALPQVPAYSVLIDINDHNTVLVGNETGVFASQNAFDPDPTNVQWSEENQGMGRVPVFAMEQMIFGPEHGFNNTGTIYLGTHGRGVYKSATLVGLDENNTSLTEKVEKISLKLYPNPVRNFATLELNLTKQENVTLQIMDIRGQVVQERVLMNQSAGKNNIEMNLSELKNGTYIIRAIQGDEIFSTKFIRYQ